MLFDESEHDKIFAEMLEELPEVKLLSKAYKLGVASMVNSLHDWLNQCRKRGIKKLKIEDIKTAFGDCTDDVELNELLKRLEGNKN